MSGSLRKGAKRMRKRLAITMCAAVALSGA
ncbi:MAG: hypothetical protein H6R41_742, partial [Deltaproteobacteria bacterium]|nr:hypothetical protein [Deltaproteobacteria bacterium]